MNLNRRDVLQGVLAGGVSLQISRALAADQSAVKAGLVKMNGDVQINGKKARLGQTVAPGDTVATGPQGEAVYVMGKDAYLLRSNSTISYSGNNLVTTGLRLLTGKVLAVFGTGKKRIETASATIGIRGTGCYIESEPDKIYFCLCYGAADVVPTGDPSQARELTSNHHDQPYYIALADPQALIRPADPANHDDLELTMLEALVGRLPPFLDAQGSSGYRSGRY